MKTAASLLVNYLAIASAAPHFVSIGGGIVHEKRELASHARWIKKDAVHGNTRLPVRIALKQRNLDKGMDYLLEVSDPESASYGKHYTQEQIINRFAPSDDSVAAVRQWLVASGIPENSIVVPRSKAWVAFDTTAEQLESVLQTKYHVYEHARTGDDHIGVDQYLLPAHVSDVVDFISPAVVPLRQASDQNEKRSAATAQVSRPNKNKNVDAAVLAAYKADPESTANCAAMMSPQCIKKLYGIPAASTSPHEDNFLGIYEADNQVYTQQDLDAFFNLTATGIPKGTHPVANLIGHVNATGSRSGGEAILDYDMAYPIVYPQIIVDYQTETHGNALFDTFLDAIDGSFCNYTAYGQTGDDPAVDGDTTGHLCGAYKPASIISVSYGLAEQDYPVNYQKRQCDEWMKLGLQGTSVILASGDYGVAEGTCQGPNEDIFVSDSASSCPYITAVGSTELPQGKAPGDPESATTRFASGGGFSNIYPQPSYQRDAVSKYFGSHDPGFKNYTTKDGVLPTTGGIYNAGGRGYPDLAAVGDAGLVYRNGATALSGGTSMSAPIVAGIFNLINEERLKAGKSVVGFINPALYAHAEVFNDIVLGDMNSDYDGQGQFGLCDGKGFSTTAGWDPVTGLGTPKYAELLNIFLSL
ncbi:hypothetical protein PWT90_08665 [Aphanocladium album]|nr:hypothetical protein PWT90_08665 [Aphanocladium album]